MYETCLCVRQNCKHYILQTSFLATNRRILPQTFPSIWYIAFHRRGFHRATLFNSVRQFHAPLRIRWSHKVMQYKVSHKTKNICLWKTDLIFAVTKKVLSKHSVHHSELQSTANLAECTDKMDGPCILPHLGPPLAIRITSLIDNNSYLKTQGEYHHILLHKLTCQ